MVMMAILAPTEIQRFVQTYKMVHGIKWTYLQIGKASLQACGQTSKWANLALRIGLVGLVEHQGVELESLHQGVFCPYKPIRPKYLGAAARLQNKHLLVACHSQSAQVAIGAVWGFAYLYDTRNNTRGHCASISCFSCCGVLKYKLASDIIDTKHSCVTSGALVNTCEVS
jgi:hypothetical protein